MCLVSHPVNIHARQSGEREAEGMGIALREARATSTHTPCEPEWSHVTTVNYKVTLEISPLIGFYYSLKVGRVNIGGQVSFKIYFFYEIVD